MKTLTMLAIVAGVAAVVGIASVPFSTISVSAAGGHCHFTSGSFGCNPGTPYFGGFNCNKFLSCHSLPNN
jgi:hypothetical protein